MILKARAESICLITLSTGQARVGGGHNVAIMWLIIIKRSPPDSFVARSEGLDHAERVSTGFKVASGGVLPERYGHGGPSVFLGNGQTKTRNTVAMWTRRRAVPAYAFIPDLT